MLFICKEAKEFVHDIKCIKYLMELCKKNGIDTNCFYELNYYKHKLQNWKKLGVETGLIKEEVDSLLSAINVLLLTVTDEKAKELLNGKIVCDFSAFDKLKYKKSSGFTGKIGITRNIYPIGFEDKYNEKLSSFILTIIFAPLPSLLFYLIASICLKPLSSSLLGAIVYILIVSIHFICSVKELVVEKIIYLYHYEINEIANINWNEKYIFTYTRTPRKVEEIQDRVLRARYMLANESCLQSLLYTYNYYVTSYQSDESTLYVVLPDEGELSAKFFFDIYAKAEFELDKYLKEQKFIYNKKEIVRVEKLTNDYLLQYNSYIN